jgi:hypothetical protein
MYTICDYTNLQENQQLSHHVVVVVVVGGGGRDHLKGLGTNGRDNLKIDLRKEVSDLVDELVPFHE